MRVRVRLCALEYRFERHAECGKGRDVATVGSLRSDVECRRLRQLLLHVRAVSIRARDCCMRECRWGITLARAGVGGLLGCMHALFACGLADGRRGREHVYAGYHSV